MSVDAGQDLAELFRHIAKEDGVDRAEAILRRIEQVLDTLAAWPLIGRVRTELHGAPRIFSVWPWLIIYELRSDGGIIVWRVLDSRRDIPALWGDSEPTR
jgi:toxin ParE1/3/4